MYALLLQVRISYVSTIAYGILSLIRNHGSSDATIKACSIQPSCCCQEISNVSLQGSQGFTLMKVDLQLIIALTFCKPIGCVGMILAVR